MTLDTYLVNFVVGDEQPGAPILHVSALVDAPTGHISGHADITQAVAPPNSDLRISNLTGRLRSLRFGAGLRHVTLAGTYEQSFPPPAIGEILRKFSAALVIEQDVWKGRGSFTYGGQDVDNVPVELAVHPD